MTISPSTACSADSGDQNAGVYRRAIIASPGEVRFQDLPIPRPGPKQVLVRIRAAALCTWEQRVFAAIDPSSYPLIGRHEFSGAVVAVGPQVSQPLGVGDQVAVTRLKRCGECWACRRGYDNVCDAQKADGREPGEPWGPGGFAEYVLAEAYQVYRMPRRVSFLQAALAEPLACVLHDVKRFPVKRGDTAVIVGAGIMGLLHLAVLRGNGATIVVSEPDPARRAKALAMGADAAIDPAADDYLEAIRRLTAGRGANVTYIAVGAPRAIEQRRLRTLGDQSAYPSTPITLSSGHLSIIAR